MRKKRKDQGAEQHIYAYFVPRFVTHVSNSHPQRRQLISSLPINEILDGVAFRQTTEIPKSIVNDLDLSLITRFPNIPNESLV